MPVPRFPLSLVVLALALALSACAPGDTSESAEDRARQEQDSPRPGPAEDALPYMEALADVYSREGMEEGLELAHPDHPAHGYFQHQIGIVQADIRSGFFSRVASMELVGEEATADVGLDDADLEGPRRGLRGLPRLRLRGRTRRRFSGERQPSREEFLPRVGREVP